MGTGLVPSGNDSKSHLGDFKNETLRLNGSLSQALSPDYPQYEAGTQRRRGPAWGFRRARCPAEAVGRPGHSSGLLGGSASLTPLTSPPQASCWEAGLPAPSPVAALSWQDSRILQLSGEGRRGLMSGGIQIVPAAGGPVSLVESTLQPAACPPPSLRLPASPAPPR